MAIAKAFATGPRPKRSLVFVWHAGEESGLYGSRYNADFPVVPSRQGPGAAQHRHGGPRRLRQHSKATTRTHVFIVGADRISTDLHNVIVETNGTLKAPLTLDYELNDPGGSREHLHAQRSLQLRVEGDSDRVLHHGPAIDYHR